MLWWMCTRKQSSVHSVSCRLYEYICNFNTNCVLSFFFPLYVPNYPHVFLPPDFESFPFFPLCFLSSQFTTSFSLFLHYFVFCVFLSSLCHTIALFPALLFPLHRWHIHSFRGSAGRLHIPSELSETSWVSIKKNNSKTGVLNHLDSTAHLCPQTFVVCVI